MKELRNELLGSSAVFSDCDRYRYVLRRKIGPERKALIVVGLNPSTATHDLDDPTIRRCKAFAAREGCGQYLMLNLFGLRSTDPNGLLEADPADKVGPEHDIAIRRELDAVDHIPVLAVAAWGTWGARFPERVEVVSYLFRDHLLPLYCLGTTKDGHPRHPLYVRGDQPLLAWETHR